MSASVLFQGSMCSHILRARLQDPAQELRANGDHMVVCTIKLARSGDAVHRGEHMI
jgi:hypothetical protein